MIWHSAELEEIKNELNSDFSLGITEEEAKIRVDKNGKNQLQGKKGKTLARRFADQLTDAVVLVLIGAAVVSVIANIIEEKPNWIEPIAIIIIVIFNALLGVFQEKRAENALDALKNMTSPVARVMREGNVKLIDASEIVQGDIILLEVGDFIPADARIIEAVSLQSEESALTGESVPVDKEEKSGIEDIAGIGDRNNMVYSGCFISYGHGKAIVTETGMNTEMGKIAQMLENVEENITPLQLKLAKLGKTLGFLALGICSIIFIIGIIKQMGILATFMTAVSLAVAAIPEGLPAIVTIVLAIGIMRMVKKNAIVRRLPAVETLGSASVICSDKTGTLTENRMSVVKIFDGTNIIEVNKETEFHESTKRLLELGVMCSNGSVEINNGEEISIGDPTETGIISAVLKYFGNNKAEIDNIYPRLGEVPFDSNRKLMTSINMIDGKPFAVVKGAPDVLLPLCITSPRRASEAAYEAMAGDALRVLGIAVKPLEDIPAHPTAEQMEQGLTFIGLIGMMDPPRLEAKAAVEKCKKAGIRTVMITGDHVTTAVAVAKKLDMFDEEKKAITGAELANMDDEQLFNEIENIAVYARMSPEDKIRIVQMWQKKGHVVSMTGDGVNDAPALKAADIGCAMGITGTDVAKGVAEMVLVDDNFATIVTAVEEGRCIFDNIRKAVHFLLSCNLGEIIAVFGAMLIFGATNAMILLPIQLLWINLITDGAPALALGLEPVEKDTMRRPPRKKQESIFSGGLGIRAIAEGILIGAITLIAYYFGINSLAHGAHVSKVLTHAYGGTVAFAVLGICQLFHSWNARSNRSIFAVGLFKNIYIIGATVLSFVLIFLTIAITPLHDVFGTVALNSSTWLFVILISFVPVVLNEIAKLIVLLIEKIKLNKKAI